MIKKYLSTANILTCFRIVLCLPMLLTDDDFILWLCYFFAGLSDICDGMAARALKQISAFGARLDSIADIVFTVTVLIRIVPRSALPLWVYICTGMVFFVKACAYIIGICRLRTVPMLHTYLNKCAGVCIYVCLPVIYIEDIALITCGLAFSASVQELSFILHAGSYSELTKQKR